MIAPDLKNYTALYERFERIVDRLTAEKKTEEADYHMINFFIFFRDHQKLDELITESERMLRSGEW